MKNSYITLVSNEEYIVGARALARSLHMVGAAWPLTVLAPPAVSGLDELAALGCEVRRVEPLLLSAEFQARHSRRAQHGAAPFTKGSKPIFHDPLSNFLKLRLWELTEFERVVFLDADTLVVQNIDRLFGYPEFSAAPNVYASLADFHRLNSGVFVAQPSGDTFARMLRHLDRPDVFWRRTDQTFLQDFFPSWHGLPYIYNTLQYVWFNLPDLWSWPQIHVIHYQYEKPWQADHPRRTQLAPLIDLWRQVNEHGTLPEPLPQPATPREA